MAHHTPLTRPSKATDKVLVYLDNLRESGRTNMFNADAYLIAEYGMSRKEAKDSLIYWFNSFAIRHDANR